MHLHAPFGQDAPELLARAGIVRWQDLGCLAEDVDLGIPSRAGTGEVRPQAVLHRQGEFDAARPGPYDCYRGRVRQAFNPAQQSFPARQQIADGLHRHRILVDSRDVSRTRSRTDVQGQQVVRDRGPVRESKLAASQIQSGDRIVDEPRLAEYRELAQVDMGLVERVVPGQQAGQHARIGRVHVAAHQGQLHARHGFHAEHLQDRYMAVPAANEHEVLDDGRGLCVHPLPDLPAIPWSGMGKLAGPHR